MSEPTRTSTTEDARRPDRRRPAFVAGVAALACLAVAAPASARGHAADSGPLTAAPRSAESAGARHVTDVDPLSLTPALNPSFSWGCVRTGSGISCHGDRQTAYGPEPAGFDCDGRPVYVSGRGEDRATRWHTAEGLATRTVVHRSFPEDRLTLTADGSGPAVISRQHWTQHYDYGVPGDVTTRVLVETGQVLMVHGPDGAGKVFQLTGLTEFAPGQDFETVVSSHGADDFAAGRDFVGEACDALT